MIQSATKTIFGVAFIITIAFTAGVAVGGKGVFAEQFNRYGLSAFAAGAVAVQPEGVDFDPVWRAWNILEERFVDAYATSTATEAEEENSTSTMEEIANKNQEKVWGMIAGLASSVGDPYTVFLPPSEAKIFNADISGSFEGVGMEISIRDRILTVVSPLKGTPAFRAGIKSADRISEIDGKSTKGMDVGTAVKIIRGEKGTDVVFSILREGEKEILKITVTRDTIEIPTIETQQRADGIFVIELSNFSAKSPELFRKAINKFKATKYKKLIIDLRGNPGGFLDAAVDMASWFLPSGKIVVTEDYGSKVKGKIHRSRGYSAIGDDVKLVILIDRGSASASEILAGSLQEYKRATLVGTSSFGKGSVQELIRITSDTSLKVTIARWLLAGDVFITKEGIEPDILVEIPKGDEFNAERDYILEKAVEFLHKR